MNQSLFKTIFHGFYEYLNHPQFWMRSLFGNFLFFGGCAWSAWHFHNFFFLSPMSLFFVFTLFLSPWIQLPFMERMLMLFFQDQGKRFSLFKPFFFFKLRAFIFYKTILLRILGFTLLLQVHNLWFQISIFVSFSSLIFLHEGYIFGLAITESPYHSLLKKTLGIGYILPLLAIAFLTIASAFSIFFLLWILPSLYLSGGITALNQIGNPSRQEIPLH